MTIEIYRQWLLKSRPQGRFALSDFELREVPKPELREGEMLIETLYLSCDPTQRGWAALDGYMPAVALGEPMRSFGLGQVVESTSPRFKVGQLVSGLLNWQEYAHVRLNEKQLTPLTPIPPFLDLELTLAFALTGLTAYFGIVDVGKVKAGETVLVSAAAGAVGSVAGQIAKIKGACVVGIAGGKEKCRLLTERLGFDAAIDYGSDDLLARLGALCPDGIDV